VWTYKIEDIGGQMLPITVVTGFLGSGKTTLINKFLTDAGEGTVVFVNEFGDVDIDGEIISGGGKQLATFSLPNGCVCCEVRDDLVDTICDAVAEPTLEFRHGIIETSGVASPSEIIRNFQTDNRLAELSPNLTVVCVCYAKKIEEQLHLYPEAANQIAMADHIVLNRDLPAELGKRDELEQLVQSVNPNARVWFDVDVSDLTKIFTVSDTTQMLKTSQQFSAHHHHNYSTFVIQSSGSVDPDLFRDTLSFWILRYPERLLRVKGIICFSGFREPQLINLVHDVFTSEPWSKPFEETGMKLVFIGINLPEDEIRRDIDGIVVG
jgi:G3E family GTPase